MSTAVSSCSGRSVRRIHHPGFADGAKVSVRLSRPRYVPFPATDTSAASVVRRAGHPLRSARRTSSTGWAWKRASAASSEACEPRTRRHRG